MVPLTTDSNKITHFLAILMELPGTSLNTGSSKSRLKTAASMAKIVPLETEFLRQQQIFLLHYQPLLMQGGNSSNATMQSSSQHETAHSEQKPVFKIKAEPVDMSISAEHPPLSSGAMVMGDVPKQFSVPVVGMSGESVFDSSVQSSASQSTFTKTLHNFPGGKQSHGFSMMNVEPVSSGSTNSNTTTTANSNSNNNRKNL